MAALRCFGPDLLPAFYIAAFRVRLLEESVKTAEREVMFPVTLTIQSPVSGLSTPEGSTTRSVPAQAGRIATQSCKKRSTSSRNTCHAGSCAVRRWLTLSRVTRRAPGMSAVSC